MAGNISVRDQVQSLLSHPHVVRYDADWRGATRSELDALEARLPVILPEAVRDWLRLCNGGYFGGEYLMGARPDRSQIDLGHWLALHPEWISLGWLPVAGDGCGNVWVVDTHYDRASQPVYFVDNCMSSEEAQYVAASDLWHFVLGHLSNELLAAGEPRWPFARERTLAWDPDLAGYSGPVPLPWDPE